MCWTRNCFLNRVKVGLVLDSPLIWIALIVFSTDIGERFRGSFGEVEKMRGRG